MANEDRDKSELKSKKRARRRQTKRLQLNTDKRSDAPPRPDPNAVRLARKLGVLQGVPPEAVIVPRAVARASQELISAARLARAMLQGSDGRARDRLIGKLGGTGAVDDRGSGGPRRLASQDFVLGGTKPSGFGGSAMSLRMAAVMGMAQNGVVEGLPCMDHVRDDLEIVFAAFALDADLGYVDGRMTTKAVRYIRDRHNQLFEAEARLDRQRQPSADLNRIVFDRSRNPRLSMRGRETSRGVLNENGGFMTTNGRLDGRRETLPSPDDGFGDFVPIPGNGASPGGDITQLFPPGTDIPEGPEPHHPAYGNEFCRDISDLCLELFEEFARSALADEDMQLIDSVTPDCLCVDGFDDTTVFTARPGGQRSFPADRGDYMLIFRGGDITDRIQTWDENAITFTIPAGSRTGFVFLRRFINSLSTGLSRTLANICGVPALGELGRSLSPSPRAIISVVHPPIVEKFTVDGHGHGEFASEACTALQLNWAVRLSDLTLGAMLPPCATIQVEVLDGDGNLLHVSNDPIGRWHHNPDADTTYRLVVSSFAGDTPCGEVRSSAIHVRREHVLYVEPVEPTVASIVAGRTGTISIRLSCPAPAEGVEVELISSRPNVLRLPSRVTIFARERSALVQFGTEPNEHGQVTITARIANHRNGTLGFDVVENLTAIVLSGGGAKGSFEVGALLYLREIWSEIQPRIVCGTSVGAINALSVAESTSSVGIDKLETNWLGLRNYADMYRPSRELRNALDALEIDFADFLDLLSGQDGANIDFSFLDMVDLGAAAGWAAAGYAVGGPVGGFVAAIASVLGDAAGDVEDVLAAIGSASYLLDLAPTEDKIRDNISTSGIASSGMKLRLALVSLLDGKLYYVTEDARLLRERAVNATFHEPITTSNPLVVSAMGSSAIPGVFQARQIETANTSMHFVDGGVREVLPAQAAVELGAQLLFNISAGTPEPTVSTERFDDPGKLLSIMKRGVDLQGTEVSSEEKFPRAGFCDDRVRVLIQPNFEVHNVIVIDPGLIRINMAYGFFRAFDADQQRRGNLNVLEFLLWMLWTDDIIWERRECTLLEVGRGMEIARHTGFFDHGTLEAIRAHKNQVAELIVERFERFGPDAFPRAFRNASLGDQSVLDWCDTWEVHQEPQRSFLNGIDLWAPQIVAPGTVSNESEIPGAPPVRENSITARYPLPPEVRDGLRHR